MVQGRTLFPYIFLYDSSPRIIGCLTVILVLIPIVDIGSVKNLEYNSTNIMNPQYTEQLLYLQAIEFSTPLIGAIIAVVFATATVGFYIRTRNKENTWSLTSLDDKETSIVKLLDSEGGEVKQKKLADNFGWSDAKVSRLTTSLEDKNIIEKSMVERENVVRLNSSNRVEE